MKALIYIFSLFLSADLIGQNIIQSSCIAPDSIRAKYLYDAQKLNVRRIFKINSTWKDSTSLNRTITNDYMKALVAVYNATALPARDSAILIYNCHARNPILKSMFFQADTNQVWMKNIKNNVQPTGNSKVDSLVSKYYLQKQSYYTFNSEALVTFKTDSSCNNIAWALTFTTVPGVIFADANSIFGEGTEIVDSIAPNFTWLVYSYGWGDCNTSCFFRHYWSFKVYNNCSVEFEGSYGDDLSTGIKENSSNISSIRIYPNPATDKITIEIDNPEPNARLFINDVSGRTVQELSNVSRLQTIDISQLGAGIYFLNIRAVSIQKTFKLIKAGL